MMLYSIAIPKRFIPSIAFKLKSRPEMIVVKCAVAMNCRARVRDIDSLCEVV